jgi:hypothetical protein
LERYETDFTDSPTSTNNKNPVSKDRPSVQQTNTKRGQPYHPMRPMKAVGDKSFSVPTSSVAPVMVPDPYSEGGYILAMRSVRDDLPAYLHTHRQIDDHQFAAARLYQRDVEMSEQDGLRAIDPTREHVDGGLPPEPLSERQQDARKRRTGAETSMGLINAPIVYSIIVEGMTYSQILLKKRGLYAKSGGGPLPGPLADMLQTQVQLSKVRALDNYGERAVKEIGYLFRSGLDCLAIYYGMQTGTTRH